MKFYGDDVFCPLSGQVEFTHSPDAEGPFFCRCCGETDHEVVRARPKE